MSSKTIKKTPKPIRTPRRDRARIRSLPRRRPTSPASPTTAATRLGRHRRRAHRLRPRQRRDDAARSSCACDAGTAFDGKHLYQIAETRIDKIDPATGKVLASIPAPGSGSDSGLTWAEGSLWVGHYRDRKIHQIDPATGAIRRTIESNRFVTGVTWVDGELWHGTWEGDESEVRRIDPKPAPCSNACACRAGAGVSGSSPTARPVLLRAAAAAARSAPCAGPRPAA
jgi:hypothetical protein